VGGFGAEAVAKFLRSDQVGEQDRDRARGRHRFRQRKRAARRTKARVPAPGTRQPSDGPPRKTARVGEMEFGLFGTFSVWRDGRRLTDREIGARKARTLLKLLVVERGRPVTIDRAVEVLWGDAPPERAEENVATVVSRLRAALGADIVAGGRGGYQLTPTAAVVVDRVVSLLVEADARLALSE